MKILKLTQGETCMSFGVITLLIIIILGVLTLTIILNLVEFCAGIK